MDQIHKILKQFFGYDHFRPLQEEIIRAILDRQNTLVLMPTGGGKSICFQVPALCLEGTALVISPLIALMKDQVESLRANGVAAAFLNSSLSTNEEIKITQELRSGKLKLLYISPEKAIGMGETLLAGIKISLIAIDEAHCISQWGHDFRPEYAKLKMLKDLYPSTPIIALTATADKTTRKDIINQLSFENPKVFISSFDRPNLRLDVIPGLKQKKKYEEIKSFINKRKGESGIIYCLSRKKTEEVSGFLRLHGIESEFYHAGMTAEERNRVQEAFIKDDVKIICATIAFGMGIDKSNIRWVIHFNLPKNMESYYQEIGRAGRDGLKSDTILFYNYSDLLMLSQFAEQSGQPEINKEKLLRIQQYAESRVCRRRILLNYFGDNFNRNCNNCDVCSDPPTVTDGTVAAQKALSALIRTGEQVGINMVINILRGSHSAEVLEKGYDKIKTYGIGKEHKIETWQAYLLQFLQLGLIEIAYDEGFTLKVTPLGMDVVKGNQKVEIVEIRSVHHHVFDDVFAEEHTDETGGLFEKLRARRKLIADSVGMAPYIIFTDKTLYEMVERLPLTKEEMLAIQGVSQNKFEKYGNDFLNLIARESIGLERIPMVKIDALINADELKQFAAIMDAQSMSVSPQTLTKILLASDRGTFPENVRRLPFFGLMKNKIKHNDLNQLIKDIFAKETIAEFKHAADLFFTTEIYNNIPENTRHQLRQTILTLPENRPTSTITNDYILNQRKIQPRSYENWLEPEITIFKEAVSHTNDINFLAETFQRSTDSMKAYYKKTYMKEAVI